MSVKSRTQGEGYTRTVQSRECKPEATVGTEGNTPAHASEPQDGPGKNFLLDLRPSV